MLLTRTHISTKHYTIHNLQSQDTESWPVKQASDTVKKVIALLVQLIGYDPVAKLVNWAPRAWLTGDLCCEQLGRQQT